MKKREAPIEPSTRHILPPHSLACPHDYYTMNDVVFLIIKSLKVNRKYLRVTFIHVRAYTLTRGYDEVVVCVIDFNL